MERRKVRGARYSTVGAEHSYENSGGEASATMEAESTLQSLLFSLRSESPGFEALGNHLRTYLLALRLLGLDEKWVSLELKGYQNETTPSYRRYNCDTKYIETGSDLEVKQTREAYEFDEPVKFLVDNFKSGWLSKRKGLTIEQAGRKVSVTREARPENWELRVVLGRISEELFDRASKTLVTARFGSAIDTIFRDYQKAVNNTLSKLDIQDHLDTAYRNLKGSTEASWRAAALACRNVLQDLSAKLWSVECDTYSAIGGKEMSVKSDKPRNRLRAYMHVKGLQAHDVPVALLDPIYAQASAAKTKSTYEDARSILIVTYMFLAELSRQTDMKPAREIPPAKK